MAGGASKASPGRASSPSLSPAAASSASSPPSAAPSSAPSSSASASQAALSGRPPRARRKAAERAALSILSSSLSAPAPPSASSSSKRRRPWAAGAPDGSNERAQRRAASPTGSGGGSPSWRGGAKADALLRMSVAVAMQNHPGDVVARAIPLLLEVLGADRCSVFLADRERDTLRSFHADGIEGSDIVLPLRAGIVGDCVHSGRTVNVPDAYADARFDRRVDSITGYRTRAILCVPIRRAADGVIGCVEMMNKRSGGAFDAEDAEMCEAFATQLATALCNARLFESLARSKRRSDALLQIMRATTSGGSITDVIEKIIQATHAVLHADRVSLYLLDPHRQEFYCKVNKNRTVLLHLPLSDEYITGHAALNGGTINIPDVERSRWATAPDAAQLLGGGGGGGGGKAEAEEAECEDRGKRGTKRGRRGAPPSSPAGSSSGAAPSSPRVCGSSEAVGPGSPARLRASVLCVRVEDRAGRPVAVIKASNRQRPPQPPDTAEVSASPASPSAAAVAAAASSSSSAAAANGDGDARTGGNVAFTAEDEMLLESMATEIAKVLRQRVYEATFVTALEGQGVDAGDADDRSILAMYTKVTRGVASPAPAHPASSIMSPRFLGSSSSSSSSSTVPRMSLANGDGGGGGGGEASQVERLKRQVSDAANYLMSPNFDALSLNVNELNGVVAAIFSSLRCVADFGSSPGALARFVDRVREGYRDNAYHNYRHGVTVLHATYMLMAKGGAAALLSPRERFAVAVAALGHDVGHPGVNNAFLINSGDELALVYNDQSVLENMHASRTLRMVGEADSDIFAGLDPEERRHARKIIITAILATDMANHFELTQKLKSAQTQSAPLDPAGNDAHKELVVDALVHAADLAAPLLPPPVARKWAVAIALEFNEQVAQERQRGLPVSGFMETTSDVSLAKMNFAFIEHIVTPLWTSLADLLGGGGAFDEYLRNLDDSRHFWQSLRDSPAAARRNTNTLLLGLELPDDVEAETRELAAAASAAAEDGAGGSGGDGGASKRQRTK